MKILICGGHLTPALAIIKSLPKETEVLYVGRKYSLDGDKALSLEYQIVNSYKIPFAAIETGRLQRTLNIKAIISLLKISKGFLQSWKIISSFSPDVIVGFGSYVSVPLCLIGWIKNIPVVIHEQTHYAGLANRIIAYFAKVVCVSWESSKKYLKAKKIRNTGNPAVSSYFNVIARSEVTSDEAIPSGAKNSKGIASGRSFDLRNDVGEKSLPRILILGGSQGSHAINILVENTLRRLVIQANLLHQTGDAKKFNDYDRLTELKKTLPENLKNHYEIVKFIDPENIPNLTAESDMVITRGGANTILGLLIIKTPALVIPLSISSKHDQWKNAECIKEAGLGEIVYTNNLTPDSFLAIIIRMLHNIKNYDVSTTYQKKLERHKDAAKRMVEIILNQATYNKSEKT